MSAHRSAPKLPHRPDQSPAAQPDSAQGRDKAQRPMAPAAGSAPATSARTAPGIAQSPRMQAQRRRMAAGFGLHESAATGTAPAQPAAEPVRSTPPNRTGLPHALKAGLEALSGMDLSAVRVHRQSGQPAQLNALAYAQGPDIHLAPGQEHHLAHEAWHVVQQRQGRVRPTLRIAGVDVNDDAGLEREADVMGRRAQNLPAATAAASPTAEAPVQRTGATTRAGAPPVQRSAVVQRLGPDLANSSAGLVAEYNALLASTVFQRLNNTVTAHADIVLVDSSLIPGQPVDYTAATHTIRVPLNTAAVPPAVPAARPAADVRDDILWEMHNASLRGALNRSAAKFNVAAPGPAASIDEEQKYPYQRAAYALCVEWEEWINVVEHDLKTQRINADPAMGGAGPHVTRSFAASFAVADAGWFLFTDYLQTQLATGHTAGYDANAANANWVGNTMLHIAQKQSAAALRITQAQVNNYQSGKTSKVKQASNNPFKNESIIKAARNHRG